MSVKAPNLSWRQALLLIVLFLTISLPRLLVLRQSLTVDENKWLTRSANFSYALREGAYSNTYQREHPGVTTMWAGTLGMAWQLPEYADLGTSQIGNWEFVVLLQEHGYDVLDSMASGRAVMVLINSVTLLIAFLYARRLLGDAAAVIGLLLISFSPFHAAHTHLLHLDGVAASFVLLSLLAFLSYGSDRRPADLIVSGGAAGLGWLTKSPTVVLIPTVGLLTLFFLWQQVTLQEGSPVRRLGQHIALFVIWGSIGALTFALLWPAMWVEPVETVTKMSTAAMQYASGGHDNPIFFNNEIIQDGNLTARFFYFYPLTYLWRSTPIVLIGLALAVVAFMAKAYPLHRARSRITVLGLVLFVVLFAVFMNFGSKKFDRYLLPVYAPLDFIAAAGWVATAFWLGQKIDRLRRWRFAFAGILAAIILIQAFSLLQVFPYYHSYYNPLLGGSRRAPEVMMIGWGEGLDEAARYLSEKPDADALRVATWYWPSFAYFFSGHIHDHLLNIPVSLNGGRQQVILNADYAVIYVQQWQRQIPKSILDQLGQQTPEHVVWINGLEYVRIYDLRAGGT